jgi:superfamily I DNA and/or RNA helicase
MKSCNLMATATILSSAARAGHLGVSLFERLERAGHEIVMLSVQYRMHPGQEL